MKLICQAALFVFVGFVFASNVAQRQGNDSRKLAEMYTAYSTYIENAESCLITFVKSREFAQISETFQIIQSRSNNLETRLNSICHEFGLRGIGDRNVLKRKLTTADKQIQIDEFHHKIMDKTQMIRMAMRLDDIEDILVKIPNHPLQKEFESLRYEIERCQEGFDEVRSQWLVFYKPISFCINDIEAAKVKRDEAWKQYIFIKNKLWFCRKPSVHKTKSVSQPHSNPQFRRNALHRRSNLGSKRSEFSEKSSYLSQSGISALEESFSAYEDKQLLSVSKSADVESQASMIDPDYIHDSNQCAKRRLMKKKAVVVEPFKIADSIFKLTKFDRQLIQDSVEVAKRRMNKNTANK